MLVLWLVVGEGGCSHNRVLVLQAKNATMKSVPAEVCAGRKAQENEVPIKRQRKENTARFNDVNDYPLTGGKARFLTMLFMFYFNG